MVNGDGKGRVGEDSLDHVLADHERNVGMVRERGFRVAEHGSSGPLEVGIVHQDGCEDGGVGLERDPDMKRGIVARVGEGVEGSL